MVESSSHLVGNRWFWAVENVVFGKLKWKTEQVTVTNSFLTWGGAPKKRHLPTKNSPDLNTLASQDQARRYGRPRPIMTRWISSRRVASLWSSGKTTHWLIFVILVRKKGWQKTNHVGLTPHYFFQNFESVQNYDSFLSLFFSPAKEPFPHGSTCVTSFPHVCSTFVPTCFTRWFSGCPGPPRLRGLGGSAAAVAGHEIRQVGSGGRHLPRLKKHLADFGQENALFCFERLCSFWCWTFVIYLCSKSKRCCLKKSWNCRFFDGWNIGQVMADFLSEAQGRLVAQRQIDIAEQLGLGKALFQEFRKVRHKGWEE